MSFNRPPDPRIDPERRTAIDRQRPAPPVKLITNSDPAGDVTR